MKAQADQAKSVIRDVLGLLSLFRDKTVYLNTVHTNSQLDAINKGRDRADGGPIDGVGGPKQDNILVNASVGEHMWTAREVANVGGHGAIYAMRAAARAGKRPKFAVGGAVDDAWNESYRSAAAAYGRPVMSQQASPTVLVDGGSRGPLEVGDGSTRAIANAVRSAVAEGMNGATFKTLDDGSVRLIMRGGR
jgi:predicted methyltransferase